MWNVIPLGDPVHEEAAEIPSGKSEKLKLYARKGKRRGNNYKQYNRRIEELQEDKLIRFRENEAEFVQQAT
jgi:ABC-type lipoprotein export system ATPase subunit